MKGKVSELVALSWLCTIVCVSSLRSPCSRSDGGALIRGHTTGVPFNRVKLDLFEVRCPQLASQHGRPYLPISKAQWVTNKSRWSKKNNSALCVESRVRGTPINLFANGFVSCSSGDFRLYQEVKKFQKDPPPNCKLRVHPSNIRIWIVQIVGQKGTPYAGEKYRLKMVFPKEYPMVPPRVIFLQPAPVNSHVYSNGDICLNIIGTDWSPNLSASTVVLAITSMLFNAKNKQLPLDNASHADNEAGNPQTRFMYHDDNC